MSHLQFSCAILSLEFFCTTKLQVCHGEPHKFLTVAWLFHYRALLYSVQLCWQNADWCNFITWLCCTFAQQNCARKLQVWHRSKIWEGHDKTGTQYWCSECCSWYMQYDDMICTVYVLINWQVASLVYCILRGACNTLQRLLWAPTLVANLLSLQDEDLSRVTAVTVNLLDVVPCLLSKRFNCWCR